MLQVSLFKTCAEISEMASSMQRISANKEAQVPQALLFIILTKMDGLHEVGLRAASWLGLYPQKDSAERPDSHSFIPIQY